MLYDLPECRGVLRPVFVLGGTSTIQHRTPNIEGRRDAPCLGNFDVGCSMLDVRCFPRIFPAMNDDTKVTFIKEDPWRIFRIMAEFVDSFETLSQVGPAVTVFGSARVLPDNPYYAQTVELTRALAKNNLA